MSATLEKLDNPLMFLIFLSLALIPIFVLLGLGARRFGLA